LFLRAFVWLMGFAYLGDVADSPGFGMEKGLADAMTVLPANLFASVAAEKAFRPV
jgi:hypothetical protein